MEFNNAEVKHEIYSSGTPVRTLNAETLVEDLTICEEWKLSIDLKLPNQSATEWRNILSLYDDEEIGLLDKLILAVSIRPGQSNFMLKIAYKLNEKYFNSIKYTFQSFEYDITKEVSAGNWINLKISQMSGVYEIKVDYKLVYNKTNFKPTTWTYVNLVTGNTNVKENVLSTTQYRNFKINSCKTKSKKL